MKKGDIVLVEFTGTDTSTNKVFDTTDEKTAKENGLYRENGVFKPIPIVIGSGELIRGLEEELEKMGEGEEKKLAIAPEKAFGVRRKELVFVVSIQEFKKRNINPFPGLVVQLDNGYGKVQSVSGGRVRIDMNSDLAGRTVEYQIKIAGVLKNPLEKAEALAKKFFPLKEGTVKTKLSGEELEVSLPAGLPKEFQIIKDAFAEFVTQHVPEIKKVRFVEEFEAKKETSKEEKK
ncbi:MAG: peptidylprolyl isomerase [archaeon]|nr:peptidylprolyl isomerase [archaeon]